MTTLTEDAHRRRELTSLIGDCEVDTDGHNAVVRLSIHQLDDLLSGDRDVEAAFDEGDVNGHVEGYKEGVNAGYAMALADIAKLAPPQVAS